MPRARRVAPHVAVLVLRAATLAGGFDAPPEDAAVPEGGRLLGIAVTEARDEDFGDAPGVAFGVGMEAASLALAWDDLETAPGQFEPDPNFLAIADEDSPGIGLRVALERNPIDTNNDRRPADLRALAEESGRRGW